MVHMGPLTFSEFTQAGAVGKDGNFGEEMITAVFASVPHRRHLTAFPS